MKVCPVCFCYVLLGKVKFRVTEGGITYGYSLTGLELPQKIGYGKGGGGSLVKKVGSERVLDHNLVKFLVKNLKLFDIPLTIILKIIRGFPENVT